MLVQSNLNRRKVPAAPIVSFDFAPAANVEVVFGSPAKNCQGMGICMIIDATLMPRDGFRCPHTKARLYVSPAGRPMLRFEKAGLSNSRTQHRVRAPLFTVEETFRIPAYLLRRIGRRGALFVAPGEYRVVEYERYFEIFF